jgi:hypothetical protein
VADDGLDMSIERLIDIASRGTVVVDTIVSGRVSVDGVLKFRGVHARGSGIERFRTLLAEAGPATASGSYWPARISSRPRRCHLSSVSAARAGQFAHLRQHIERPTAGDIRVIDASINRTYRNDRGALVDCEMQPASCGRGQPVSARCA